MTKNVLITLPNSRQGQGICKAFLQCKEDYKVFGTTNDPEEEEYLMEKGITPVRFEPENEDSFENALKESQASVVVLVTGDEFGPRKILSSENHEFENAKIMIDTCTENKDQIDHLFLISLFACDEVPESMTGFKAKHHIERYLFQQMSVNMGCFHYDIIRSGILFEFMDGGRPMNSLKPGKLSSAFAPTVKIPYVASLDVGKAVLAMLHDPDTWGSGQILHAVSTIASGKDCAMALSIASGGGDACKYQIMPNMSLLLAGFGPFAKYFGQYASTHASKRQKEWRKEFLEVVPDTMGLETFFSSVGQWSDGTKFGAPAEPSSPMANLRKLIRPIENFKIADEDTDCDLSDCGVPTDYAIIRIP